MKRSRRRFSKILFIHLIESIQPSIIHAIVVERDKGSEVCERVLSDWMSQQPVYIMKFEEVSDGFRQEIGSTIAVAAR